MAPGRRYSDEDLEGSDEFLEDEPPTDVLKVRPTRPLRRSRPARLRMIKGPGAPREIPWSFERLVVGSDLCADLVIPGLAPRHIVFERRNHVFFCIDLSKREGMRLNGLPVHSCALADRDTLDLDLAIFVFEGAED